MPTGALVLVAGKGKKQDWTFRRARLLVRKIVLELKDKKANEALIDASRVFDFSSDVEEVIEMIAIESLLANFSFDRYKTSTSKKSLEKLFVRVGSDNSSGKVYKDALSRGVVIGEETNRARVLSNTPGGEMTPELLAKEAISLGSEFGFMVEVLNSEDMKKLGMGGVLGVGGGSSNPPKFIIMKRMPNGEGENPLVIVGKGVTFDSGGLNIKPGNSMSDMYLDMSGGSAVICAMAANIKARHPCKCYWSCSRG